MPFTPTRLTRNPSFPSPSSLPSTPKSPKRTLRQKHKEKEKEKQYPIKYLSRLAPAQLSALQNAGIIGLSANMEKLSFAPLPKDREVQRAQRMQQQQQMGGRNDHGGKHVDLERDDDARNGDAGSSEEVGSPGHVMETRGKKRMRVDEETEARVKMGGGTKRKKQEKKVWAKGDGRGKRRRIW